MKIRNTILTLFTITTLSGLVAACDNTIRGIGQDINDSAEAVEESTE